MAEDKRTVKRKEGEKWVIIPFKDLRRGDVFQLFNPDGEQVINKETNEKEWVCTKDAWLDHKINIWTCEVEYLNE